MPNRSNCRNGGVEECIFDCILLHFDRQSNKTPSPRVTFYCFLRRLGEYISWHLRGFLNQFTNFSILRFAHIPQTGVFDASTKKMMESPRCGMADKIGKTLRKRRYNLQGSKWKKWVGLSFRIIIINVIRYRFIEVCNQVYDKQLWRRAKDKLPLVCFRRKL